MKSFITIALAQIAFFFSVVGTFADPSKDQYVIDHENLLNFLDKAHNGFDVSELDSKVMEMFNGIVRYVRIDDACKLIDVVLNKDNKRKMLLKLLSVQELSLANYEFSRLITLTVEQERSQSESILASDDKVNLIARYLDVNRSRLAELSEETLRGFYSLAASFATTFRNEEDAHRRSLEEYKKSGLGWRPRLMESEKNLSFIISIKNAELENRKKVTDLSREALKQGVLKAQEVSP
jgi:hypothetical protein